MSNKFYRINGLGAGFDGLIVEVPSYHENALMAVLKIHKPEQILGDRHISWPLPTASLFIDERFLDPCEDPTVRQYETTHDFGTYQGEGHVVAGPIEAKYALFANQLQVTITEWMNGPNARRRTKWTGYFGPKLFDRVIRILTAAHGDVDAGEELIFNIMSLKTEELNGKA